MQRFLSLNRRISNEEEEEEEWHNTITQIADCLHNPIRQTILLQTKQLSKLFFTSSQIANYD